MSAVAKEKEPRARRRLGWWLAGGAVLAVSVGLWTARTPIADNFIREQLEQRGIPARYTIRKIGLRTQRLTDIVIGDPRRPDLTARSLEVVLDWGFTGPYVSHIRAERVRVHGRYTNGRLSFGALDRFSDPDSTDPFALPDIDVALDDARARILTPWGNVGAALNGSGNLRNAFTGKLALIAPRLSMAGCAAQSLSFYGDVRVRDVRPQLDGPLRAARFDCADGVAAKSPQVALDLSLSEDLRSWKGRADARVGQIFAGGVAADRVGLLTRFEGNIDRTAVTMDANVGRLGAAGFTAQNVRVEAKGVVGAMAPRIDGAIAFDRASASPALRRSIAEAGEALTGSPIWPLAVKATRALARLLEEANGQTRFAVLGEGEVARFEIIAPAFAGKSGARFTGDAQSRIAYLFGADEPTVIANGRWAFGGDDLPTGTVAFDRLPDGSISGLARFEDYRAEGAHLSLTPVRFAGGDVGELRFTSTLDLTGPLAGGRLEGLRVPLAGMLTATGRFALDGGCRRVAVERVALSGFRIGRSGVDLCSRPGAPLLSAGPEGVKGWIGFPRLSLRGSNGASPLALDSKRGEFDLASMRWSLAGADVRIGEGESMTRFAAERISGHSAPQGLAGELAGAEARIGAVPLDMSEIDGRWRWADNALSLDGGLTLTDAEPDARFYPLESDDARLRFADGAIEAVAGFRERKTGTKILDTAIRHRFSDGSGSADLKIPELRFDDAFQPDQLTRLARGVVANVDGSVVGDGRIEWTAEGVTSRGTFATANTNLAAAFGPAAGLTTTLTFDDLINLQSAPGQTVRLGEVNPGIPVIDGEIEYRLLPGNRVRIEGGRWPFAGGDLLLHPTTLDFNASQPRRLRFDLIGVNAAAFLQQFGFENINATGLFDGTLPVEFDGLGGRIVDGRIDARDGGGTLAYVGELSNHNLGAIANFAFGALRSLKYDDLAIILNGDLDGEMVTDIRFGGVGQGEGATRNFLTNQIARIPLVFNVKVTAPFRQLITSAKGFYDPTILIEQNLPALMRAQEEAEAAASVQPPESEPVQ